MRRPIACAISCVSIVPDAPTSVPATISKVLSSTYPDAATVRPVNAFSNEITTGTSAPPTGSTNSTPSTNDRPVQTTANGTLDAATAAMPQPTAPSPTSDVTICAPGTRIGRPVMSSCSFAKVMSEPVKLTLPTMAVNATAIAAAVESTRVQPHVFVERDQHRGAAADAVEQRDHLRNRGHLDHAGGGYRERGTDNDGADDERPVTEAALRDGDDDGEGGAERADEVAVTRSLR